MSDPGTGIIGRNRFPFRAMMVLVPALLSAACAGRPDTSSTVVKWYTFREPSGAFVEAARRCSESAGGRYRIEPAYLPADADQQREQLVRRLAAGDPDIDLMALDVIWTAEFAQAGWLRSWEGEARASAVEDRIGPAVQSATYRGRLWAVPFTSNTQLLWYRKDRVNHPPRTWAELIRMGESIGPAGRVQLQGHRYEGLTVFFISLLASSGGAVLDPGGERVSLEDGPALRTLRLMRDLANSRVADPSLSTAREDEARLAFETGKSSFMINYPFVWPSARSNAPALAARLGWARWPRVDPDRPSRVTLGGVNLGVGAFSRHPGEASQAAICLARPDHQERIAERGGLLPTRRALYDRPRLREAFPFADVLRETLQDAVQRPQTPLYSDLSLAISRTLHPMRRIEPERVLRRLRRVVGQALRSEGLT